MKRLHNKAQGAHTCEIARHMVVTPFKHTNRQTHNHTLTKDINYRDYYREQRVAEQTILKHNRESLVVNNKETKSLGEVKKSNGQNERDKKMK